MSAFNFKYRFTITNAHDTTDSQSWEFEAAGMEDATTKGRALAFMADWTAQDTSTVCTPLD